MIYKTAVFDAFSFQPFRYIRKEYAARELKPALESAQRSCRNVRYIKICAAYDVTMANDAKLIVSRNRVKDLKTAFTKYWGNTRGVYKRRRAPCTSSPLFSISCKSFPYFFFQLLPLVRVLCIIQRALLPAAVIMP